MEDLETADPQHGGKNLLHFKALQSDSIKLF